MNPLDLEKINLQREEIIEKIKEWVKESGLSLEQIVKPGLENAPYAGKVQGNENLGYNVLFAEKNKDFFFMTTYFRFQEKDGRALFYLDPSDQKKFIQDIKITLLQMNLNYIFLPVINTDIIDFKSLESLEIHKTIYFDGFSKNIFFEGVNDVLHGAELILLLYARFSNSLFSSSTRNKN